jgi:hypothetical protein
MLQNAETDFREYRCLQKRHVRRASGLPLIFGRLRLSWHVVELTLLAHATAFVLHNIVKRKKNTLVVSKVV